MEQQTLTTENPLLQSLIHEGAARLNGGLNQVELTVGQILFEAHTPIDSIYFPEDSMVSLMSVDEEGSTIEVAAIGHEGVAGISALLDHNTVPYRAVVQAAGRAWQIPLQPVKALFEERPEFRKKALKYLHKNIVEIAQSGICNCVHSLEQRLARWLLSYQDRTGESSFPYTHEFLAAMLGTRRESITQRLRRFQKLQWIRNSRGNVTIINRDQLEKMACECYSMIRSQYQKL